MNDGATVYYTSTEAVNLPTTLSKGNKTQSFGSSSSASIYIGETENTTGSRISVILHGTYNGTNTWYRFDMITKEAQTLTALLRNHHYIFNVAGINHLGSESEAEALNKSVADNQMVESDVDFFDITNDAILSITSDDASYVGVSAETITMSGDAPVGITVLTNNTEGWEVDDSDCEGAFDFSGETPVADKVQTLWVWKKNTTSGNTYTFYITAGNIRKAITVTVE